MAKRKSSIPKFMKHAGSIDGPPDLSSRRCFSRVLVTKAVDQKIIEQKTELKLSKKPQRETWRAVK
jgi:hypothetical protein